MRRRWLVLRSDVRVGLVVAARCWTRRGARGVQAAMAADADTYVVRGVPVG